MDANEIRRAFLAMKAKADADQAQKQAEKLAKDAAKQKMLQFGLDVRKGMAMANHVMKQLDNPWLKTIRTMDNRPAEKVVMEKTKGMKKRKGVKSSGVGGPGV